MTTQYSSLLENDSFGKLIRWQLMCWEDCDNATLLHLNSLLLDTVELSDLNVFLFNSEWWCWKIQCIIVVQMVSGNQCWDHQLLSAADARKLIPCIEVVESKLRSHMFPYSPLCRPSPPPHPHTQWELPSISLTRDIDMTLGCVLSMFHTKRWKMCILYVILLTLNTYFNSNAFQLLVLPGERLSLQDRACVRQAIPWEF